VRSPCLELKKEETSFQERVNSSVDLPNEKTQPTSQKKLETTNNSQMLSFLKFLPLETQRSTRSLTCWNNKLYSGFYDGTIGVKEIGFKLFMDTLAG